MKTKNKFIVTLTLFLIGGLVSTEIKAQKGEPFRKRKANDAPYTKEEQKAYYRLRGEFFDSMRNERVRVINTFMKKHGEKLRVETKHIGWTIDQTHWVEKKEFSSKVVNEYRIGSKIMRDVTAQKTTGYYSVFSYNGWSEIIDDPSCMNINFVVEDEKAKEKENKEDINDTPQENPESKNLADVNQSYDQQAEPEECWEYVWRNETYYTTETSRVVQYAGVGENTGYYGNRYSSNRTYQVPHTKKVLYKVRCGQSQQDQLPVMNEEIPRDEKGEPEKSWCERNPVLCTMLLNARINVGVQVSGNNNNNGYYYGGNTTGGTYTQQSGGPVHTGGSGNGGPVHTGGRR